MAPQDAYKEIVTREQERTKLVTINYLLEWDMETNMPPAAENTRAEQTGLMARLIHERATAPKLGELIAACENTELTKEPKSVTAVNIREWRRSYDRATKLPTEHVEEFSRVTSKAHGAWAKARRQSDFSIFAPHLEKILDLNRKSAEFYGYDTEPYDALMEEYEPGMTAAEVEQVFAGLRKDLVELVGKIADAPKKPDIGLVKRPYDVDRQRLFSQVVAAAFGYDFTAGRLDEVTHPFCTWIGPGDTRICTRYYPNDFAEGLTGVTHETGHALYDMGLPHDEHFGTPMSEPVSLGIHESQSRTWENQVGRSRSFWRYFFPQAQRMFREELDGVSEEDFYAAFNYVTPSYIRVEADEATYNLHIMLRFELERAIFRGEVPVKDIPGEWNARFKDYLGIEVDKDSNGCLQDVHWAMGAMGYFPTYALGNLYAAQFWVQINKDIPDLDNQFASGDFSQLLGWLRKNIHSQAKRYSAPALVERVTGETLSHQPLLDYLYTKYEPIYGIRR